MTLPSIADIEIASASIPIVWRLLIISLLLPTSMPKRKSKTQISAVIILFICFNSFFRMR